MSVGRKFQSKCVLKKKLDLNEGDLASTVHLSDSLSDLFVLNCDRLLVVTFSLILFGGFIMGLKRLDSISLRSRRCDGSLMTDKS